MKSSAALLRAPLSFAHQFLSLLLCGALVVTTTNCAAFGNDDTDSDYSASTVKRSLPELLKLECYAEFPDEAEDCIIGIDNFFGSENSVDDERNFLERLADGIKDDFHTVTGQAFGERPDQLFVELVDRIEQRNPSDLGWFRSIRLGRKLQHINFETPRTKQEFEELADAIQLVRDENDFSEVDRVVEEFAGINVSLEGLEQGLASSSSFQDSADAFDALGNLGQQESAEVVIATGMSLVAKLVLVGLAVVAIALFYTFVILPFVNSFQNSPAFDVPASTAAVPGTAYFDSSTLKIIGPDGSGVTLNSTDLQASWNTIQSLGWNYDVDAVVALSSTYNLLLAQAQTAEALTNLYAQIEAVELLRMAGVMMAVAGTIECTANGCTVTDEDGIEIELAPEALEGWIRNTCSQRVGPNKGIDWTTSALRTRTKFRL